VLDRTPFAGGPFVAQFEQEFAAFCDTPVRGGRGSGTDALWMALLGLGYRLRGQVITRAGHLHRHPPRRSVGAGRNGLRRRGPSDVQRGSRQTRGGDHEEDEGSHPCSSLRQMADMDPIMESPEAQVVRDRGRLPGARGREYKGKKAGSIADAGCFSFYPGKNSGRTARAGAVITNNEYLDQKIRMLRDTGRRKNITTPWLVERPDGRDPGGDTGGVKLRHLPAWTGGRRRKRRPVWRAPEGSEGRNAPTEAGYGKHVLPHLRDPRGRPGPTEHRPRGDGYPLRIHYPIPSPLDAYKSLNLGRDLSPWRRRARRSLVSLPMFAELTREQIQRTCTELKRYFRP